MLASVTEFLEKKLKLKVNREKSAVGKVQERKFLGHRLVESGELEWLLKAAKDWKQA